MLYSFEDFAFDTARRELWRGSGLLPIERQVFDVIEYLIRNRERSSERRICSPPFGMDVLFRNRR